MGGLGGDNMTIIIVCFLHGKPWQNLVDKCKKIHSEKKALSKLLEPAFSTFDRFASDGPFSEVSVLKTSDDSQNSNESSSHTSSPSSSPISTEDKFEGILTETLEVQATDDEKMIAVTDTKILEQDSTISSQNAEGKAETVKVIEVISETTVIESKVPDSSSASTDSVSNGNSN
jgi:hypothetical protein